MGLLFFKDLGSGAPGRGGPGNFWLGATRIQPPTHGKTASIAAPPGHVAGRQATKCRIGRGKPECSWVSYEAWTPRTGARFSWPAPAGRLLQKAEGVEPGSGRMKQLRGGGNLIDFTKGRALSAPLVDNHPKKTDPGLIAGAAGGRPARSPWRNVASAARIYYPERPSFDSGSGGGPAGHRFGFRENGRGAIEIRSGGDDFQPGPFLGMNEGRLGGQAPPITGRDVVRTHASNHGCTALMWNWGGRFLPKGGRGCGRDVRPPRRGPGSGDGACASKAGAAIGLSTPRGTAERD